MRKVSIFILSAVLLCSCTKNEKAKGSFTATIEGCNTKTELVDGHDLEWQDGDQILVGVEGSGTSYPYIVTDNQRTSAGFEYMGTGLEPEMTGDYVACYPPEAWNEACTEVTIPATQTVGGSDEMNRFPMVAFSNSRNLHFKNLCGVVKIILQQADTRIDRIDIETTQPIAGLFTVSHNSTGIPQLTPTSSGSSNRVTLRIKSIPSIASASSFYVYLPAGDYSPLAVTLYRADCKVCTKRASTTISVRRNEITTLDLHDAALNFITAYAPEGAVAGNFTIGLDDNGYRRQVYIAKGNLQYIGSATPAYWKFAEHQYDVLGTTTGQTSSSQTCDRDLFGWGTTGQNTGAQSYQPWSMGSTSTQFYPGGNYRNNLSGNSDWGYNPISNGGGIGGLWRTPTSDEMDYILFQRDASTVCGTANARFLHVDIGAIQGILIFPDFFSWPDGVPTPQASYINDVTYNHTLPISMDDWAILEQAGCIFLPPSGYRTNTTYNTTVNLYWTSTHFSEDQSLSIVFGSNSRSGNLSKEPNNRYAGLAVRLVMDK